MARKQDAGSVIRALACLSLTACASSDVPALISPSTMETRSELARAVTQALNGRPVTLADDALTRESLLIIERPSVRDASGVRLTGRDFDEPERFRLVKNGTRCTLVHERTGARAILASASCQPAVP